MQVKEISPDGRERFFPAGSPEAVELARRMGLPDEAGHYCTSLGLAAIARQRKEAEEKRAQVGKRYMDTLLSMFFRAYGLAPAR